MFFSISGQTRPLDLPWIVKNACFCMKKREYGPETIVRKVFFTPNLHFTIFERQQHSAYSSTHRTTPRGSRDQDQCFSIFSFHYEWTVGHREDARSVLLMPFGQKHYWAHKTLYSQYFEFLTIHARAIVLFCWWDLLESAPILLFLLRVEPQSKRGCQVRTAHAFWAEALFAS